MYILSTKVSTCISFSCNFSATKQDIRFFLINTETKKVGIFTVGIEVIDQVVRRVSGGVLIAHELRLRGPQHFPSETVRKTTSSLKDPLFLFEFIIFFFFAFCLVSLKSVALASTEH